MALEDSLAGALARRAPAAAYRIDTGAPRGASNLSRWTFPARAASTSGYGSSISC